MTSGFGTHSSSQDLRRSEYEEIHSPFEESEDYVEQHVQKNAQKGSIFYEGVGATPIKKNGPKMSGDDERILLNVGGVRHETHVSTLRSIPCTRLSRLADLHVASEIKKEEYFFDRHPSVFNSVIDYYRTGELHVPLEVCGAVVKRELDYWQVNQYAIKSCCWRHYRSYIENKWILDSFNRSLQKEQISMNLDSYQGWKRFQMRMWFILEHPRTSRVAMVYGVISLLFVVVSISGFCLETLPALKPVRNVTKTNTSQSCNGDSSSNMVQVMTQNEALNILDIICTIYFTIELTVRFIFAPNKKSFVVSAMNIIDLLALVPLYMQSVFNSDDLQFCYVNERLMIEIMFILRIIRMFRIFHLVKHYQALKILVYALKASVQELLMLFIFLIIGMLVFASMIYYAERKDAVNPSDTFDTIPKGFWWSLITMTTVGYGDVYPKTLIGYIVGSACAVTGVLMIALTIPVISNNFTLFYTHVRSRGDKDEEKQKKEFYRGSMRMREDTVILQSEDDGYGTVILQEDKKRKASAISLVDTYMNGHATLRNFSPKTYPKYRQFYHNEKKNSKGECNSMNDIVIRNSHAELSRTDSDKAKSDDGVAYCEPETML